MFVKKGGYGNVGLGLFQYYAGLAICRTVNLRSLIHQRFFFQIDMFLRKIIGFVAGCLLLATVVACQPTDPIEIEVTREVSVTREVPVVQTVEVTREFQVTREIQVTRLFEVTPEQPEIDLSLSGLGELGSVERPFLLVFLPTAELRVVEVRGGFLAQALFEATGYEFELVVPVDEEEARRLICESPQETIGILTAAQYVQTEDQCGVQLTHAARRFDVPYSLGMLVARQDRVINIFEDLAFKQVGVPSFGDLATYQLFADRADEMELEGVEYVAYGTSSSALIAMLEGEIDIAAAVFNPPILPREERVWVYGEDRAEVWRQVGVEPERNPIGYIDVLGTPEQGAAIGFEMRALRFLTIIQRFLQRHGLSLCLSRCRMRRWCSAVSFRLWRRKR